MKDWRSRRKKQTGRRLCAYARRTLTAGHLGLVLCLCCLWILLDSPLRGEALLYAEAAGRYDPSTLTDGWHTLPDGEKFFYISNPALGLWADKSKF